jgi:serine/threonine protein phosphatase 1
MKHCVVGDVHGEYRSLLNLVAKTPKGTEFIFVGDLIDRGTHSAHVIQFVRKYKLACVKGNHEEMMIQYGSEFIFAIENAHAIEQDNKWLRNGGKETLLSYDLVSLKGKELVPHTYIMEFLFQFKEDIEWLKSLPLYLDLGIIHPPSGRRVVVSHSSISSVWDIRDTNRYANIFKETVLWHRTKPLEQQSEIFNIFGHTPQSYSADMKKHYVNIDTGCYIKGKRGYGLLSAYCIESGEIYSSSDIN